MRKEHLDKLISESIGNESNICQVHVIKNGDIVYDSCFHGYKRSDAVNVYSVTKGIMSLLAGIAIDLGYIKSVNQKVLDFFPDYRVKRGEKTIYDVCLKHLLTMTAPYKYRSEPWTKVCTSDDWTVAALDLLGGRNGITGEFKYATLGIQILAGVIESAAKVKCIDFANENLFKPLGIPEHTIRHGTSKEEHLDFVLNKNPRKDEWFADSKNTVTAGWGLCLSSEALAKIGTLLLNEGKYNGQRIISREYLSEMTTPYIKLDERFGNMNYGYLWYKPFDNRNVYAAIGNSGNIIYANIDEKVSVGITGTFKPRIFDRIKFIEDIVLPSL